MDMYENEILNELSNEQLVYLIDQLCESQFLIGEICVDVSKSHISCDEAISRIRESLYALPLMFDATDMGAYIDVQIGKISVSEYRKIIGLD